MIITQTLLDGLIIASEKVGQGIPVLLLHGWGGRIESMHMVAQALEPLGYEAYVLDLPGFGRSTIPAGAWGVADYAQLVIHYLDQVGVKPINLVGHSFGGRVSIVIGAEYPEYVSKIVLTDSAGVLTPPTANQQIRQLAFASVNAVLSLPGLAGPRQRFRQWVRDSFGSEDLRKAGSLEPIFRRVVLEDLVPYAAKIKAPTLLIWGDQDTDTPLWQAQKLEKTIPDAGLVVFNGAGHFAYQERLPEFIRIIDTFFRGKTR